MLQCRKALDIHLYVHLTAPCFSRAAPATSVLAVASHIHTHHTHLVNAHPVTVILIFWKHPFMSQKGWTLPDTQQSRIRVETVLVPPDDFQLHPRGAPCPRRDFVRFLVHHKSPPHTQTHTRAHTHMYARARALASARCAPSAPRDAPLGPIRPPLVLSRPTVSPPHFLPTSQTFTTLGPFSDIP